MACAKGLRFYPLKKFENYLMFYRTVEEEEVVEIVRIVPGCKGFAKALWRERKLTSTTRFYPL
jgi:hypothetical protein